MAANDFPSTSGIDSVFFLSSRFSNVITGCFLMGSWYDRGDLPVDDSRESLSVPAESSDAVCSLLVVLLCTGRVKHSKKLLPCLLPLIFLGFYIFSHLISCKYAARDIVKRLLLRT